MKTKTDEKMDNTLIKYFFTDEKTERKVQENKQANNGKITIEKIQKFYRKSIKLRNALKQCYWERQAVKV
jgi:hypothetical protein